MTMKSVSRKACPVENPHNPTFSHGLTSGNAIGKRSAAASPLLEDKKLIRDRLLNGSCER